MTIGKERYIINRTYIRNLKGYIMAISYNGLWKKLIDKGMNKGDLKKLTGLSSGTIAKMTNGEAVTLTVLEKICVELHCNIGDLVEIDNIGEDEACQKKV